MQYFTFSLRHWSLPRTRYCSKLRVRSHAPPLDESASDLEHCFLLQKRTISTRWESVPMMAHSIHFEPFVVQPLNHLHLLWSHEKILVDFHLDFWLLPCPGVVVGACATGCNVGTVAPKFVTFDGTATSGGTVAPRCTKLDLLTDMLLIPFDWCW